MQYLGLAATYACCKQFAETFECKDAWEGCHIGMLHASACTAVTLVRTEALNCFMYREQSVPHATPCRKLDDGVQQKSSSG